MPDLAACPPGWYCLLAQPKREHLAAQVIQREAGLTTFCPRLAYVKMTARGRVRFVEALFPGYLFVQIESLAAVYRQLRAIKGVREVVQYGQRVPTVPEALIRQLQARLVADAVFELPEPGLQVGERVRVLTGPFAGFEAIINELKPARERVALLLEFLGETRLVDVAPDQVAGMDQPSVRQRLLQP